jgi:hypothetical protein
MNRNLSMKSIGHAAARSSVTNFGGARPALPHDLSHLARNYGHPNGSRRVWSLHRLTVICCSRRDRLVLVFVIFVATRRLIGISCTADCIFIVIYNAGWVASAKGTASSTP